jgi:hypothetical protein
MYRQALEEFEQAGEHLDLFVKGNDDGVRSYLSVHQGKVLLDELGQPVLNASPESKSTRALGAVNLYADPADEKPSWAVYRQSKVRIVDVAGANEWLQVATVNDRELQNAGWIKSSDVYWFPEAVDLYSPRSPMRGGRSSTALSQLDQTASNLDSAAQRFNVAAQRIEDIARPFDVAANRFYAAADIVGRPTRRINEVLGQIDRIPGVSLPRVPNPLSGVFSRIGGFAGAPGGQIRRVAGIVRTPAGYLQTGAGYARLPGSYARTVQSWSGVAGNYYYGHRREAFTEARSHLLLAARLLDAVLEKPIAVDPVPWHQSLTSSQQAEPLDSESTASL